MLYQIVIIKLISISATKIVAKLKSFMISKDLSIYTQPTNKIYVVKSKLNYLINKINIPFLIS